MSTNVDPARKEGSSTGSSHSSKSEPKGQTQDLGGQNYGAGFGGGSEPEAGSKSMGRGTRTEDIGGQGELREELQKVGKLARDAAYEQMDNLRTAGREKTRQLEDHIVDQPLKSIGIAAAVGFVLGLMWMRR